MKSFEAVPDKYTSYISQIRQRQGIATLPTYIETSQYGDHILAVEVADWMRKNAIDYNAWCRRNPSIAPFSVASDSKPIPWCADASLVTHKRNHAGPPLMESYLGQIGPFLVAQQPSIELTYANTRGGTNEVKLWDQHSCPVIAGCIVRFSREGDENSSVIFVNPRATDYYRELVSKGAIFTDPLGKRPMQRQIANMRKEHNRQFPSIALVSQPAPFGVANERAITLPELNLAQRIVQVNEQIAKDGIGTTYVAEDGVEWRFVTSSQVSEYGGMGHAGILARVTTGVDGNPQRLSAEPTHPLLDSFLSNLLQQGGYVTLKQMSAMYPEEQLRYVLYKMLPTIPGLQKSQYDAHNIVYFVGDPVAVHRRIDDDIRISLSQKPDFKHILGNGRVVTLGGSHDFMQEIPTSQSILGIGENEDDKKYLIQGLSLTQYTLISFIISQGGTVSESELGDALSAFCQQQGIQDMGEVDRVRRLCRRSSKEHHIFGPQCKL